MAVPRVDPRIAPRLHHAPRPDQPVGQHRPLAMPALGQHMRRETDRDLLPAQRRQFRNIGRHQRGERHQPLKRRDGLPVRQHRSEEHTSELQSLMRISYAVFCLKKKNKTNIQKRIKNKKKKKKMKTKTSKSEHKM